MAVPNDRTIEDSTSAIEKKPWTMPELQMIQIDSALGASAGTKCDRYGSLSHGTGCP
jgi:hypothetical protein